MSNIYLTEIDIQQAVQRGLRESIEARLRYSDAKKKLDEAIDAAFKKAMTDLAPVISREVEKAVLDHLQSGQFKQALDTALADSIKRKYVGAFDAVVIAAARRSADGAIKEHLEQLLERAK